MKKTIILASFGLLSVVGIVALSILTIARQNSFSDSKFSESETRYSSNTGNSISNYTNSGNSFSDQVSNLSNYSTSNSSSAGNSSTNTNSYRTNSNKDTYSTKNEDSTAEDLSNPYGGYDMPYSTAPSYNTQPDMTQACQNWQQRYNYAQQMFVQAAYFGDLQTMNYWQNETNKLNFEIQQNRYCGIQNSGVCDRASYNSCISTARSMRSPTDGTQTTTGIFTEQDCYQWISGCR